MGYKYAPTSIVVQDVIGAVCDECAEDIELFDNENPIGGLEIEFIGGYAMYFDGKTVAVLLCAKCAKFLFFHFPSLAKLISEN